MKTETKNGLIAMLIAILVIGILSTVIILSSNNNERDKYEFLEEAGHNVAYLDYGIFNHCGYKKYGKIVDCDYEYRNAKAEAKFAQSLEGEGK